MTTPPRPLILHVVDDLGGGGLQRNLLKLVAHTRGRFDHAVFCLRERGELAGCFETLGVGVDAYNKELGNDWWAWWEVARYCRRLRPRIVHVRNWGAIDGVVGARVAGVPAIIYGEHGWDEQVVPKRRAWVLRGLSAFVHTFVAVSSPLEQWLRIDVGIPAGKVVLIHNGTDVTRFGAPGDRIGQRQALGYRSTDVVVGSVARLAAVKRFDLLLAGFARCAQTRSDVRLLIVGDGPERAAIERDIAHYRLGDAVSLLGQRENVEEWLPAMDIFASTSSTEGLPSSVLEAMCAGLPVVATAVGGISDLVVDGVTGCLVDAGDPGALAGALRRYADDARLRSAHATAGRNRARDRFGLDRMIAAYTALYERLLGRPSGAGAEGDEGI